MLNNDTSFQSFGMLMKRTLIKESKDISHKQKLKADKRRMQLTIYAKVTFIIVLGIVKE